MRIQNLEPEFLVIDYGPRKVYNFSLINYSGRITGVFIHCIDGRIVLA